MMEAIRIIGIDPGLRYMGWGIIETHGSRLTHIASGLVKPPRKQSMGERLLALFVGLATILDEYEHAEAAVEETFVNRDPNGALKLGQARGIALLAPARKGMPVAEYAANRVKKSVVGSGHAEKAQVESMIRILLPTARPQSTDAADALAIAVCHAHYRGTGHIEDAARESGS